MQTKLFSPSHAEYNVCLLSRHDHILCLLPSLLDLVPLIHKNGCMKYTGIFFSLNSIVKYDGGWIMWWNVVIDLKYAYCTWHKVLWAVFNFHHPQLLIWMELNKRRSSQSLIVVSKAILIPEIIFSLLPWLLKWIIMPLWQMVVNNTYVSSGWK